MSFELVDTDYVFIPVRRDVKAWLEEEAEARQMGAKDFTSRLLAEVREYGLLHPPEEPRPLLAHTREAQATS